MAGGCGLLTVKGNVDAPFEVMMKRLFVVPVTTLAWRRLHHGYIIAAIIYRISAGNRRGPTGALVPFIPDSVHLPLATEKLTVPAAVSLLTNTISVALGDAAALCSGGNCSDRLGTRAWSFDAPPTLSVVAEP